MLKIYRYYPQDEEYQKVVNDPKLKGKKRDKALAETAISLGQEVSIRDYFSDSKRKSWRRDYSYICQGEAENIIERLVYAELEYDDDLSYCDINSNCPEDLTESRTDWDDMKRYADGLLSFIDSLKYAIASGEVIINDKM